MTLLFISYKTNTDGVVEVKERLKQANYAIWFDKDAIRGGDRDWQAEIDRGIDRCDALILCLTEQAAASEFVRYEVARMRRRIDAEQQRLRKTGSEQAVVRIFPVLFQTGLNNAQIAALLEQVGLEARVQCFEPVFLGGHLREDRIAKLLQTMRERDIAPSRFDVRKMQPDSAEAQRYRYYLRALIDHHKSVNITTSTGQRGPDGRDLIAEVGALYVPSPTEYKLVLKIEHYDITRTWLCQDADLRDGIYESASDPYLVKRLGMIDGEDAALRDQIMAASRSPDDWNETVLDTLIEQRREQLYQLKQADRSRRLGRLDDVTQVITLDMIQVAALFRRVIFYGDSGAGKTTFAQYMMVSRAGALLGEIEARELFVSQSTDWWPHHSLTPVYIDMTDLALALDSSEWSVSAFLDYLALRTSDHDHAAFVDHLRDDLSSGMALLILDKLEGIFPESRAEVTVREAQLERFFNSMLTRFKGLHLLLLTRRHWMPAGFLMASVQPLAPEGQAALLAKFFTRFPPQATPDNAAPSPQALAQDSMGFLGDYAAELAGNPRFVTLFATLRERRYGDLYRSIATLLLRISQQARVGQPLRQVFRCTDDELLPTIARLLSDFAFQVISEYPEGIAEDRKDRRMRSLIRDVVGEYHDERGAPTDAMIQYLTQESGVFVSPPLALDFASEGFKAYFAAEHIKRHFIEDDARRSDEDHTIVRELIEDAPDVWFEALRIVADLFINPEDPTARATDLIDMVDDLVDDRLPALVRPDDARFYSAWFAARVAVDQGLPDRPEFSPRDRRDAIRKLEDLKQWLVLMLDMPKAPLRPGRGGTPDIRIRAESGRLLGRLGDPRPGVGLRPDGLPDILWVGIPAGAYTVGAAASETGHPGALPQQAVTCPAFWLSRYPVTYAQFGAFVAAGGYEDPAYWSPTGWQWKRDATCPAAFWDDPYWHVSNHPVVGVSWYEADAFCRWLDAVSRDAQGIRLPSEAEWEIGARGQTAFAYPYGPEHDAHRANGRTTRLDRTSAVGLFNEGDSPFGLADMSGNVYEWCSDTFLDGPANASQAATPITDITRKRALRGGSWRSYPGFLRVDARYGSYPYLANNYWGFRLACDFAPDNAS